MALIPWTAHMLLSHSILNETLAPETLYMLMITIAQACSTACRTHPAISLYSVKCTNLKKKSLCCDVY